MQSADDEHKYMINAGVVSQEEISPGIYSLRLDAGPIAHAIVPGQFVSLYMNDSAHLLPRPLSICDADPQKGLIRLVYRAAGAGTAAFSRCRAGESLRLLGPLGNGYPLYQERKALIVGGGTGIPPMLYLAKSVSGDKDIVLGYKDQLFLKNEFEPFGTVYTATEDGSSGVRGTVLDAISENDLRADVIYACGPKPMLKAVKEYAAVKGMECLISLEERMACGIGACLACVCGSAGVDGQTNVHRKRVCRDGPVFHAEEVVL